MIASAGCTKAASRATCSGFGDFFGIYCSLLRFTGPKVFGSVMRVSKEFTCEAVVSGGGGGGGGGFESQGSSHLENHTPSPSSCIVAGACVLDPSLL